MSTTPPSHALNKPNHDHNNHHDHHALSPHQHQAAEHSVSHVFVQSDAEIAKEKKAAAHAAHVHAEHHTESSVGSSTEAPVTGSGNVAVEEVAVAAKSTECQGHAAGHDHAHEHHSAGAAHSHEEHAHTHGHGHGDQHHIGLPAHHSVSHVFVQSDADIAALKAKHAAEQHAHSEGHSHAEGHSHDSAHSHEEHSGSCCGGHGAASATTTTEVVEAGHTHNHEHAAVDAVSETHDHAHAHTAALEVTHVVAAEDVVTPGGHVHTPGGHVHHTGHLPSPHSVHHEFVASDSSETVSHSHKHSESHSHSHSSSSSSSTSTTTVHVHTEVHTSSVTVSSVQVSEEHSSAHSHSHSEGHSHAEGHSHDSAHSHEEHSGSCCGGHGAASASTTEAVEAGHTHNHEHAAAVVLTHEEKEAALAAQAAVEGQCTRGVGRTIASPVVVEAVAASNTEASSSESATTASTSGSVAVTQDEIINPSKLTHSHAHDHAHGPASLHAPSPQAHGPQYPPLPPKEKEVVHLRHTGNLDPVTGTVLYTHLPETAAEIYKHTHDAKLLPKVALHEVQDGDLTPHTPHAEPHTPVVHLKAVDDLTLKPAAEEHAHLNA